MALALGLTVHTGWAAGVVAGGSLREPRIEAREHMVLLGDPERFVFHRAEEMARAEVERWVAQAEKKARSAADGALKQLAQGRELVACAIVAKPGKMGSLAEILASHPRIHTSEGLFYRDVLRAAAEAIGLAVHMVSPDKLDAKDPRLIAVGRAIGKPWNQDCKLAALAAWRVLDG
jgi:hypothetical protein